MVINRTLATPSRRAEYLHFPLTTVISDVCPSLPALDIIHYVHPTSTGQRMGNAAASPPILLSDKRRMRAVGGKLVMFAASRNSPWGGREGGGGLLDPMEVTRVDSVPQIPGHTV